MLKSNHRVWAVAVVGALSIPFAVMATFGALGIPLAVVAASDGRCTGKETTQAEMTVCALATMNLERVRLKTAQNAAAAAASDDTSRAQLRKSNRAWETFQDAECERQTSQYYEGSMYPAAYGMCHAHLMGLRSEMLENP
jgi:uncharacterized protein YecT (DUF1311 family)